MPREQDKHEVRGGIPAEIRADDTGITVSGYAAVFNQEADIGGWYREIIEPGAFAEAIGRDDVVFLINHEGLPLARSRAGKGTLTLTEDEYGLKIETKLLASDPDVQSIVPKMQRGDLDKMSFAFLPDIQEWDDTQEPPLRRIKKLRLFDVAIVTTPAYDGTDIGLRSLEAHRAAAKRQQNFNAANKRIRLKMNLALKVRENG